MSSHKGPHIPCCQKFFFILSLFTIPAGLGTIASGILIIVFELGRAFIVTAAVVISIGFCLTAVPAFISIKVFHLRIKSINGNLRITKSYAKYFDEAKSSRENPEFKNVGPCGVASPYEITDDAMENSFNQMNGTVHIPRPQIPEEFLHA